MEINLNTQLNNIISKIDINNKPNLFLHVCCAPCSTAVLEKLYNYFNIYIIYYNSNIDTLFEFKHRLAELCRLLNINKYNVQILYDDYNHDEFLKNISGLENEPEGGIRCKKCYELRLRKTFEIAIEYINTNNLYSNKNYLCSTLSISPYKNAKLLYEIGNEICDSEGKNISYLPNDFKKENGYLKSIELSKKYKLYRQDYCGCEFAKSH